ncbi:hypothetical protein GQ54DRAFT_127850 [Martensiomyces pterosporus]|nr:hypothetical protein GQ54DRAFT_127850 [Martensiomyces pterosporus]
MPVEIMSPSGDAYRVNGFQSLSGKKTLQLRPGAASRQQKQGTNEFVAPRWCPAIDVLAVPEGRALRLVRLSGGQTIWRRTPSDHLPRSGAAHDAEKASGDSQAIRAIAWHPLGAYIAALHADGSIVQREPTHGDIVHESKIELSEGERVAALEWIWCKSSNDESSGSAHGESNISAPESLPFEFSLPMLSPLDKGKSVPSYVNSSVETPTSMVAVTSAGAVWVCVNGIFALPVVRPPRNWQPPTADPTNYMAIDARINSDSSKLHVLLSSVPSSASHVSHLLTATLNTPILASPSPLLHSLASSSAHISGLCLYLENTIDCLIKESEARSGGASRSLLMHTLERVLQDHGVDEVTSPEAEMTRLAVTGRASEPTSQFLLAKLKASKLSNWESAGRLGAVVINRLVYQHALPAIERAILAITKLLQVVLAEASHLGSKEQTDSTEEDSKSQLLKAVVILGWLYARLEEYMVCVREEQRENQEFVDWALFAIQDLNWQNEGSRRIGNDDHNDEADDGSRPVRPHTDYKLLLRFIRKAFHRQTSEQAQQPRISDIVYTAEDSETHFASLTDAYFDVLVHEAHLDSLDYSRLASPTTAGPKWVGSSGRQTHSSQEPSAPFGFVFHSKEIMDAAVAKAGLADESGALVPPTCQEALAVIKSLVASSLKWPSSVLGSSLQWDLSHGGTRAQISMKANDPIGHLSDMRQVGSSNSAASMYIAASSDSSDVLEIISIPQDAAVNPTIASIALVVEIRDEATPSPTTVPIHLTDISFFDDDVLGIVFTIDGCDSPYLGALEYRDETVVHYFPAAGNGQATQVTYTPLHCCRFDAAPGVRRQKGRCANAGLVTHVPGVFKAGINVHGCRFLLTSSVLCRLSGGGHWHFQSC